MKIISLQPDLTVRLANPCSICKYYFDMNNNIGNQIKLYTGQDGTHDLLFQNRRNHRQSSYHCTKWTQQKLETIALAYYRNVVRHVIPIWI